MSEEFKLSLKTKRAQYDSLTYMEGLDSSVYEFLCSSTKREPTYKIASLRCDTDLVRSVVGTLSYDERTHKVEPI